MTKIVLENNCDKYQLLQSIIMNGIKGEGINNPDQLMTLLCEKSGIEKREWWLYRATFGKDGNVAITIRELADKVFFVDPMQPESKLRQLLLFILPYADNITSTNILDLTQCLGMELAQGPNSAAKGEIDPPGIEPAPPARTGVSQGKLYFVVMMILFIIVIIVAFIIGNAFNFNSTSTIVANLQATIRSGSASIPTPTPVPLGGGTGRLIYAASDNVYLVSFDEQNPIQLNVPTDPNNTQSDYPTWDMPAWSPDGTKLALVDSHNKGLYLYDFSVENGNPKLTFRMLIAQNAWWPSWSPDGKSIAYNKGSNSDCGDIWITQVATGSIPHQVTDTVTQRLQLPPPQSQVYDCGLTEGVAWYPAWSRDKEGDFIAFNDPYSARDPKNLYGSIWIVRSNAYKSAGKVWIENDGKMVFYTAYPNWSPDGKNIAFDTASDISLGGDGQWKDRIFTMASETNCLEIYIDSSDERDVTEHCRDPQQGVGKRLSFLFADMLLRDPQQVPISPIASGTPPSLLIAAGEKHYHPSWSPDCKYIAFTYLIGNDVWYHMVVIPVDAQQDLQLISPAGYNGGQWPAWQPSSNSSCK